MDRKGIVCGNTGLEVTSLQYLVQVIRIARSNALDPLRTDTPQFMSQLSITQAKRC